MVSSEPSNLKQPDVATEADRRISPWTMRQKVGRALWYAVRATLFRFSPRTAYGVRRLLLRCFGAAVDRTAHIHASARIEIPWHLEIGPHSSIGEFAIIYNLGRVTLGRRVSISQYAHLCAGTHDYTRYDMPLIRPPIHVEDDAWVAADAFVGPGVTVGHGAIVGARAAVFKDVEPWTVVGGNPAKFIKRRELRHPDRGESEA